MSSLILAEDRASLEGVVLVHENDLAEAIKALGWQLKDEEILDKDEVPITCVICGEPLTLENLGTFFPGSIEAVCKKFACFVGEMSRVQEKMRRVK